ncbi:uv radiation resistance protein [Sporothrix brasiliensis 5110]|uniref:Autophagy-related protein 14 n=1 Tax=Sporothrix brasiliensis 5110 TaxID=1398154 RepID=A0A0C2J2E9_9PEZI|nr:uv radiation resistance protein [Sporothrix brasiliensis 5110]KIH93210.1 uv radiation resistance protein [Sporothrix brasiliensis 5110]
MAAPQPAFLLPQNRKLRHLRGIYLRNLTFSPPRKHSVDDSGVGPGGQQRRASLRKALHHSRSSDDLLTDSNGSATASPSAAAPDSATATATSTASARNRSATLSGADALARQHILEQVLDSSTADAFFSLHNDGADEPIYVSEVAERAANFNFRFFDLAGLDPFVSRSSQLTVKVWVRRAPHASTSAATSSAPSTTTTRPSSTSSSSPAWFLLLEDDVDLRFLGCIGSLQSIRFPPNALVFHLLDGIYMAGAPRNRLVAPAGGARSNLAGSPPLPTSSYNALMRLANLENSLQDCLATQDKLSQQIEQILDAEQQAVAAGEPAAAALLLPEAEAGRHRALKGLAHRRRLNDAARRKRADLASSLEARRAAIAAGRDLQQRAWADVEHAAHKLESSRATAQRTRDDIRGQRRRICEDLIRIFNIARARGVDEPLAFQICGMPLPNTVYGPLLDRSSKGQAEDTLSAALGFVAVLVAALETYLGVALPYRITAYGSRSVVRDDISKNIPDAQRDFPLFMPRGGHNAQYRFDYAWFLLNKDIETLCHAQGLKVVDIRHTLPNLQYLLYVCSAGTADLPERKKGGVRGLWMGHMQRHGVGSSRDDVQDGQEAQGAEGHDPRKDAAVVTTRGLLPTTTRTTTRATNTTNTASNTTATSMASSPASTLHLPFDETATKWTLRTKGMRERD